MLYTLSHYLENITQYFTSNTRITFLHGVHEINKSGVLLIKNVFSLTLTGYNITGSNTAKIICMQPATLKFSSIVNLMISHLSVLYCGYPVLQFINGKEHSSVAVYFLDIFDFKLSNTSVENSTGYGVVGVNVLGHSSICHSKFLFNNYYTLNSTNCSPGSGSCKGGNMYLFYETLPKFQFGNINSVFSIDSCMFRNGVDISEQSSGLTMCFYNTAQDRPTLAMGVTKRSLYDQHAYDQHALRNVLIILGTNYPDSHTIPDTMARTSTTGMSSQTFLAVHISDSKFYDNIGGGVHVELYMGYKKYKNTKYQVFINKCSFQRNQSPIGSSVRIGQPIVLPSKSELKVLIQDTDFMYDMIHAIQKKTLMVSMSLRFMD